MREILPPIAALHEAGFCHRDISPENIIRSSQHHKPVLIDFGSSAQYRCGAEVRDRLRVAKQGYTAPEQQEHGEFSPQSDFFSLGCTLIFLLTGRDPDTFSRDAQGHLNWKGELDSNNRLVSLIDQMVALNPHDRPGSSQAIAQTLATLHEAPPDMSKKTTLLGDGAAEPLRGRTIIHPEGQADLDPQPLPPRQPKPPLNPVVPLAAVSLAVAVGLVTVGIVQRFQGAGRTDPQPPMIEAGELEPPTLPEDGLTPETPAPTITPAAIATPTPKPSATPTPASTSAPSNSAPSPVEAAPASNPAPVPVYEPEPYYAPEPAYEPEPYYAPEPAYEPEPYYAPEPVYVAPAPAPAPPASNLPSCADVAWGACQ
ncbi:MAG: protein kinase [Coleofasciculaceae cyanobacterium RL_1_1]|nr:protein kinase [Coleofasciculaceae cyanobacterium RL_1_1]